MSFCMSFYMTFCMVFRFDIFALVFLSILIYLSTAAA